MPSLQDSAVIFILALILFGPKKLPELARQLGKLMAEFRRASAEFRMQMDEELRVSEQAERQKEIAAIEAAAPPTPALADNYPAEEHPHLPAPDALQASDAFPPATSETLPTPLPIAISGDLSIMPPATGLPTPRSTPSEATIAPLLDAIPHAADPEPPAHPGTPPAPPARTTQPDFIPAETTLHA